MQSQRTDVRAVQKNNFIIHEIRKVKNRDFF